MPLSLLLSLVQDPSPQAAEARDQPAPAAAVEAAAEATEPFTEADFDALAFRALPRDAFPVATMPAMSTASEGDEALALGDLVIGLELDGEAQAYPLRVMGGIELVNGQCGELPIAVSW